MVNRKCVHCIDKTLIKLGLYDMLYLLFSDGLKHLYINRD